MMVETYNKGYEGEWRMRFHDADNDLKRWFENYKLDKNAYFASDIHWLSIEQRLFVARNGQQRKKFVGVIGADHSPERREVAFEVTAPAPPTFYRPAKQTLAQRQAEERRQQELEGRYRRQDRYMADMLLYSYRFYAPRMPMMPSIPPPPPPPPQHRRNV